MEQKQKNIIAIVIIIAIIIITAGFVWQMFAKKLQPPAINDQIVAPITQTPETQSATQPAIENSLQKYSNENYGIEITFPDSIKKYEVLEFPWSSHEKAYNSVNTITFATENEKFTNTESIYLKADQVVKEGDLISFDVYDKNLCNDTKTDAVEKSFCDKYATESTSLGVVEQDSPIGYWIKNNKYVFFFKDPKGDDKTIPDRFNINLFEPTEVNNLSGNQEDCITDDNCKKIDCSEFQYQEPAYYPICEYNKCICGCGDPENGKLCE